MAPSLSPPPPSPGLSVPLIELKDASYRYEGAQRSAVDNVSLSIQAGEYLAVVGPNGSGKSSLLRLLNGLLSPQTGSVRVGGLEASDPRNAHAVRSALTLVFQSPADQIVSTVVEEDVAFGPENLGLSRPEIARRVAAALEATGLTEERCIPPHFLSAGQQQRLAVAGAIAMEPRAIAFDEATSMLDPGGRDSVLALIDSLAGRGMAIIHVTHDMSEAARAGRIVAMVAGKIAFDGSPAEFWGGRTDFGAAACAIASLGLPSAVSAARSLGVEAGAADSAEGLAALVSSRLRGGGLVPSGAASAANEVGHAAAHGTRPVSEGDPAFSLEAVSYTYLRGTTNQRAAVEAVSFAVPRGAVVALVGKTGSGKSTILQLMDSIAFPTKGRVICLGEDTTAKGVDLRRLRTSAPLSVQRPESALFEPYAGDDVAFGPRNLGLQGGGLVSRVREAMELAGLPFGDFRDRRTRALSGGEKRRLALAGVFALAPEALLLDEPSSALDPAAKRAVLDIVIGLARKGMTVVMATHSMEEAARADFVGVVSRGRLTAFGPPEEIFYAAFDPAWGIGRPFACELALALRKAGHVVDGLPLDLDSLALGLRA